MNVEEAGIRLLILMYDMSNGKDGVPLNPDVVRQEAAKMRLFSMTTAEFEAYKSRVAERIIKLSERVS